MQIHRNELRHQASCFSGENKHLLPSSTTPEDAQDFAVARTPE
jgi:hypothetical protein